MIDLSNSRRLFSRFSAGRLILMFLLACTPFRASALDCGVQTSKFCKNCETNSAFTVGNDSKCNIAINGKWGVEEIILESRPEHGKLAIEQDPTRDDAGIISHRRMIYIPNQRYVGKDKFSVNIRLLDKFGREPEPSEMHDKINYDVEVVDHSRINLGSAATPSLDGVDSTVSYRLSGTQQSPEISEWEENRVDVFRLSKYSTVLLLIYRNGNLVLSKSSKIGETFNGSAEGVSFNFKIENGAFVLNKLYGKHKLTERVFTNGKDKCRSEFSYSSIQSNLAYDFSKNGIGRINSTQTANNVQCNIVPRG